MAIFNQIYFSILFANIPKSIGAMFDYFACEEPGYNPEKPCDQSQYEHKSLYFFLILSHISVSLFPVSILMFLANVHVQVHKDKKIYHYKNCTSLVSDIFRSLFYKMYLR